MSEQPDPSPPEFEIEINNRRFRVRSRELTGAELRAMTTPAIGLDFDLVQISFGPDEDDVLVRDDQTVDLENGSRFFSSPKTILAG